MLSIGGDTAFDVVGGEIGLFFHFPAFTLGRGLYPVSDGGRRDQSCIFFESVLAKKVRTDPGGWH